MQTTMHTPVCCQGFSRAGLLPGRPRQKACARLPAATAAALVSTELQPPSGDPYVQLAELCRASGGVTVSKTQRGRGLVLQQDMPAREAVLTVPLHNALIIADEPTDGISIFSDRQHRQWQDLHGELPPLLLEFLQGDARWDARMAGWLLWMRQHPSPLWRSYLALLPAESDMSCLLNFSLAEIEALQVPQLKEEAAVQAKWCTHLHAKYFSSSTGSLAPLGLSSSLAHSLWAISLVRSRTFSEDVNGEMLTLMVPYCDMANHCPDHNSTFCISRDFKSFNLRSLRDLVQGEECTISYGAVKPNCEALRDYGFVLPGNCHDRLSFGDSSSGADKGEGGDAGGTAQGSRVHGLNEASLMEAAGFTGDLAAGNIASKPSDHQATPEQQQQLARREAVLLSLPLSSPFGSSSSDSGGLFGWLTDIPQPWTESGKPPPQPLRQSRAAAERAAVQALQQQLRKQLADLPTSIAADQQLLARMESGTPAGGSSGSSSSSHAGDDSVQQRRQVRLQQQQQQQASAALRRPPPPGTRSAGGQDDRPPSAARIMMAVRARLEHKLLLQEGLNVLQQYEQHLADRFGAAR